MADSPEVFVPSVVVDADVASFFVNNDPVRVPRYEPHLRDRGIVVPFAAYGEMLFGAELRNWGPIRRVGIHQFIARGSVWYPNARVCEYWSHIRASVQRSGRLLASQDAWVAATALHLDLPLVSHNARHFIGVPGLHLTTEPDLLP